MRKTRSNKLLVFIIIILLILVIVYLFFPFQDNNFLKKVYSPICSIKSLYQGQEYLPTWCLETSEESKADEKDTKAGLANPAAVKCIEDGGSLERYFTKGGEAGLCIFADKSVCNQWAYFREECSPGQCQKECDNIGTNKEGYYNSCTGELIGIELCAPEEETEVEEVEDESVSVVESNIKLLAPISDQQLSSPFVVKGTARVFENKIYVRVIGRNDNVLIEESTDVKSADMGDFSIDINYEFDLTKAGKVEVYSKSAKDGAEENLVSIPVKF
jgi:putative hemolysin